MDEFERQLSQQPLRPPPPGWRAEILASAGKITTPAWVWRDWLWPSPAAWGALAAVWILFFALDASEPVSPAPRPRWLAAPAITDSLYALTPGRDFNALLETLAL
jgi:hypothetical protein